MLTYSCNLSCKMCGLWGEDGIWKDKEKHNLKLTDIKSFIDEVSRYKPMVLLTGGEPLLNEEWVKVAQYLKEKKLRVSISTNGTYITKYENEIMNFVDVLDVSLDGIENVHNEIRGANIFENVISCMKSIDRKKREGKKIKPYIKISFTIQEINFFKIVETVEYLDELGIDIENFIIRHLQFSHQEGIKQHQKIFKEEFNINTNSLNGFLYNSEKINPKKLIEEIKNVKNKKTKNIKQISFEPDIKIEELNKFYKNPAYIPLKFKDRCFAPYLGVNIAPSGDIWMCPDYCIGKVEKDEFKNVWNGKEARNLRERIKHKGLFPLCRICAGLYVY